MRPTMPPTDYRWFTEIPQTGRATQTESPMILPPVTSTPSPDPVALRAKAEALEAAFLAEMLGHAGLGASDGPFGGGAGEEHFASFLRHAQAEAIVRRGGIGLAETIFRSIMTRADAAA
jgi:hypothetical protein